MREMSGLRTGLAWWPQPVFVPVEGEADPRTLKEYECILRRRVGRDWPWQMSDEVFTSLEAEITSKQATFFGHAQTLRASLAIDSPDELLRKFSSGTTQARAALHLARAAARLGHVDSSRKLISRGLELAGEAATVLRSELRMVLESSTGEAAQEGVAADRTPPRG